MNKTGAWLIGICGNVGTTVIAGSKLIEKNLSSSAGLITETSLFKSLPLAGLSDIVFGGHEIKKIKLYDSALKLNKTSNIFDKDKISLLKNYFSSVDKNIKPGFTLKKPLRKTIELIQKDILSFKNNNNLSEVVVVNISSTEPRINENISLKELENLIDKNNIKKLSPSVLYAYSAIELRFPYINFTPSSGSSVKGLIELAENNKALHMGRDGKTGETLVKSVLAPMFKSRNMEVLSWQGYNMLGNEDGRTLNNPAEKKSKITSKNKILKDILGYSPHSHIAIDYVPSLDDWKTAWDFIHFKGFLDTKMTMQFTWQGCDSILAAPLVIDLIRLAEYSKRQKEAGIMDHLSCFFKDPMGNSRHDFHSQVGDLFQYFGKKG